MSEAKPDNLRLWKRHADIDPKFTKAITGRDYTGTSPNPQYVIQCLTDLFGPVGQGFGWRVVAEGFERFGDTALHWCRIEFWHTDRANTFEAYGQTKAAYITSKGLHRVDEDAPKKSLTDAIVKAASQIGVAANIFLGRWDDQKYVQQVAADHAKAEAVAKADPEAVTRAIEYLTAAESVNDLTAAFKNLPRDMQKHPDVIAAGAARKAALQKPADDLGGDYIPDFGGAK